MKEDIIDSAKDLANDGSSISGTVTSGGVPPIGSTIPQTGAALAVNASINLAGQVQPPSVNKSPEKKVVFSMSIIKLIWRVIYVVSTLSFIVSVVILSYSLKYILDLHKLTINEIDSVLKSIASFCIFYAVVIIINFAFNSAFNKQ